MALKAEPYGSVHCSSRVQQQQQRVERVERVGRGFGRTYPRVFVATRRLLCSATATVLRLHRAIPWKA